MTKKDLLFGLDEVIWRIITRFFKIFILLVSEEYKDCYTRSGHWPPKLSAISLRTAMIKRLKRKLNTF